MSEWSTIRLERDGGVAVLTIDRPEKLNALNAAVMGELEDAVAALEADPELRGVLIRGAGDKAFVAGADITELADLDPLGAVETSRRGQDLFSSIEALPVPVVAAIGGYALGGGCELALACHLRVASERAQIGLPEVGLGLIPGYGGTVRLARLVGVGRALELILTAEPVTAAKARDMGLVNQLVPDDQVDVKAEALLDTILSNGPVALRLALRSVYGSLDAPVDRAMDLESTLFGVAAATEDVREGTAAFLERRKPDFEGR